MASGRGLWEMRETRVEVARASIKESDWTEKHLQGIGMAG